MPTEEIGPEPKDSYWFVDEDKKMQAMCLECHKTHPFGWFWQGRQGYGDYDLKCVFCNGVLTEKKHEDID